MCSYCKLDLRHAVTAAVAGEVDDIVVVAGCAVFVFFYHISASERIVTDVVYAVAAGVQTTAKTVM